MSTVIGPVSRTYTVRLPRPELLLTALFCTVAVVLAIAFAHDGPATTSRSPDRAAPAPAIGGAALGARPERSSGVQVPGVGH